MIKEIPAFPSIPEYDNLADNFISTQQQVRKETRTSQGNVRPLLIVKRIFQSLIQPSDVYLHNDFNAAYDRLLPLISNFEKLKSLDTQKVDVLDWVHNLGLPADSIVKHGFEVEGIFEHAQLETRKIPYRFATLGDIITELYQDMEQRTQDKQTPDMAKLHDIKGRFVSIYEELMQALHAFVYLQKIELPAFRQRVIKSITDDEIRSTMTADPADETPFPGQTPE